MCAAALGAKKVYAFEPVNETFEVLKSNISSSGFENVIIPVNAALGRERRRVKIRYIGSCDGAASFERDGKGLKLLAQDVEAVPLDDVLGKQKCDFIKADVEGHEENVILGARKTILRCKPRLAISAYHKPLDDVMLPRLVKFIRSDYACKIVDFGDTVLLCE